MTTRSFNIVVLLFWLTSMGWLFQQKILPTLTVGDPPSYRSLLAAPGAIPEPVGWRLALNGRPLGWAISAADVNADGGQEFITRLFSNRVPLAAMTPAWVNSFVRLLQEDGTQPDVRLDVDMTARLSVDPLGRPYRIDSVTALGYRTHRRGLAEGFRIRMDGKIENNQLALTIRAGDASYSSKLYLPNDSLLSDALSPQARLPNLKVGQSWNVPIYSPFSAPTSPMEILHAEVERTTELEWEDRTMYSHLVVYRSDAGHELSGNDRPHGRCWVAQDGRVLRQEFTVGTGLVTFERVGESPPRNWRGPGPVEPEKLRPWWRVEMADDAR